ncbi:hypothetical protein ACI8AF_11245 [Blastococcus sp. SYSU D00669]
MRRCLPVLLAAALLVAGCGSDAPPSDGKAAADTGKALDGDRDEADGSGEAGSAGDRGNTAATTGTPVTVTGPDGAELVELTVVSIEGDFACTADPELVQEPENGHFVAVQLEIAALPGLAGFQNPFGAGTFTLLDNGVFSVVGRDGVVEDDVSGTAGTFSCTADGNDIWTQAVAPGERYEGVLVLDSASTSGTVVWRPVLDLGEPEPGWEWAF